MRKGILVSLALLLVAGLLLAGCAGGPKRDANPTMVTIATTPMPAGKYVMMAAMAKVLSDKTLPTSVVGVGGGFAQVMSLVKGTAHLSTPMSPEAHWAYTGYQGYKEFADLKKQPYLRKIMTISVAPEHVLVMNDSPIKSLADLPKIIYNQAGAYTELSMIEAILEAYGIPKSSVTFKPMAHEEKYASFSNRKLDVLMNISTIPGAGFVDIASRFDVRFLSWDEAKLDMIVKKYPLFEKVVIPAGMYKQKEPILAIAAATDILTYESYSEDLAYKQVKALLENTAQIVSMYKGAAFLDTKHAVKSIAVPYHPGAIKYYREKGVWTAEHDKKQQELLASVK